jgi:hypothetical protein
VSIVNCIESTDLKVRDYSEADARAIAAFVNRGQYLKRTAAYEAALGALFLAISIHGFLQGSIYSLIPGVLGLFAFIAGLWQRRGFSISLTVIESALFGMFGVLLLVGEIAKWFSTRVQPELQAINLTLLTLGTAAFGVSRLISAIRLENTVISAEQAEMMNTLLAELAACDPAYDSVAVRLSTVEWSEPFVWCGILRDKFCIFARQRELRMRVANRAETRFEDRGPGWVEKDHRCRLRLGRSRLKGLAGAKSCSNLQGWLDQSHFQS